MTNKLSFYWESLRTSYWFVPAVMSLGAIGAAFAAVSIDSTLHARTLAQSVWWVYGGGPEGARGVLSAIASSMITVAGVVFSITIVALSLASSQFGPRLLRNFIRDRSNQVVLGTFTGTYVYCLIVLRTVRSANNGEFVPGFAVALGILLALISLGVLIYFIHHVAISIQANHIVAAVSQEMHETIDRLWPDALGDEPEEDEDAGAADLPDDFDETAQKVCAEGSGYIATIEGQSLMELAKEHELIVRLARRPGHFVVAGSPLAWVWPGDRLDDAINHEVNRMFLLEPQRTPFQDLEFTVDQLVEVAVRALSPGINDPFTAISCIDWLSEALARLAGRSMPSPYRYDDEGRLRVITRAVGFENVADAAFNQIRQYGRSAAAVIFHLLEAIETLAGLVRRRRDRVALQRHAKLIHRCCVDLMPDASDREDLDTRFARVMDALQAAEKAKPK